MTNSFNLQFWKGNILASHPALQQPEYQVQPRLAESSASENQTLHCDVSFLLLLEGSFSISPKQRAAQLSRTQGSFVLFTCLAEWTVSGSVYVSWMLKYWFRLESSIDLLLVSGSLITPTAARAAQHNKISPYQPHPKPQTSSSHPTFNNTSALRFYLVFLHCWIYVRDLLNCMSVLHFIPALHGETGITSGASSGTFLW